MTNANNPMDKDTTTDDILGGDIVLQYMDKEMGDDSCSTLTDVAYQADVLDEGGIYDKKLFIVVVDTIHVLKEVFFWFPKLEFFSLMGVDSTMIPI